LKRPVVRVADASVVLKWVLPEPGRAAAVELLDAFEAGAIHLLSPPVLIDEVCSALAKRHRRGLVTADQARAAFRFIEERVPAIPGDAALCSEALELSLAHHIGYWDALYLALAVRHRCDMVTADTRFHRAASRHYPYVVLLN
jgi:predicted nucleic acid-binding protein